MYDGNATSGNGQESSTVGSGLYVDVENLHQVGQTVIQSLVETWPVKAPTPSRLTLFVRADQVELWRLWATSQFKNLNIVVNGTQHFSLSSSKNSADIAIATRAMADLVLKRVNHIVVISDDSDFISLYVAIRDDPDILQANSDVPFLWVITDREESLSPTVKRFFPPEKLHIISTKPSHLEKEASSDTSQSIPFQTVAKPTATTWVHMAQAVIEDIPVGIFKSTDCQPVIKKNWPNHALAKAAGPAFGTDFKNNILPILEQHGVKIENPGKKPIRYRMTTEAKQALS